MDLDGIGPRQPKRAPFDPYVRIIGKGPKGQSGRLKGAVVEINEFGCLNVDGRCIWVAVVEYLAVVHAAVGNFDDLAGTRSFHRDERKRKRKYHKRKQFCASSDFCSEFGIARQSVQRNSFIRRYIRQTKDRCAFDTRFSDARS
jgi:hypothetical protein